MNPSFLIKNAFILAIGIYGAVAWFICNQNIEPLGDPGIVKSYTIILSVIYALTVLLAEPLISAHLVRSKGGYDQNVMIVKLGLLESGAVYGLFLTLMTRDINYVFAFGAIAAFLITLRVPIPKR